MFTKQSIYTGCLAIAASLVLNWLIPTMGFYIRILVFIGLYFLSHIIITKFSPNKDDY